VVEHESPEVTGEVVVDGSGVIGQAGVIGGQRVVSPAGEDHVHRGEEDVELGEVGHPVEDPHQFGVIGDDTREADVERRVDGVLCPGGDGLRRQRVDLR
jgi:hypothetical protein